LLRQDFGPVAEEYAQKAAILDPKLPLVHFLLGELNLYHSKIPEAIEEFQKELALNPVTRLRITNLRTLIPESRNSTKRRSFCNAPFGLMRPPLVLIF